MKLIRCAIKKNRTASSTSYEYPKSWDATKINVVAYEEGKTIGNVTEDCIAIINDDIYAAGLLKDPAITTITEIEANTFGDTCRPQRVMVDDTDLPDILVAIKKNVLLRTQHEKELLDETVPGGIHKTKKFNIADYYG